nr:hypothetical protein [Tanacetum cinerariifolium]
KKEKLLQLEQWANLSNHPSKCFNSFCYDDDDDEDYTIAVIPVLSTEEPENSLSMGDEHLDTIPAMESDKVIKSSVENLIPILSESEGILEHMCDVPFHDNSPPLDVSKDQFEDFSDSNDEFSSIDDDSFFIDNIDYVEASPPDFELVSSKVMEIVILEVGGIDDDILLTIKDDILHEKLLNVNLLITKIEALNANPTPSSDCKTNPTTHSDSSLYASFIFDLSINPFPLADRSDFYEFIDKLIPFISSPEYDCFLFKVEPNSRDFTMDVVEDISPNKEPHTHNALPTHPTLQLNLKFQPSSESLFTYVVWIFFPFLLSSIPGNMKTLANGFCTKSSSPLFNLGITWLIRSWVRVVEGVGDGVVVFVGCRKLGEWGDLEMAGKQEEMTSMFDFGDRGGSLGLVNMSSLADKAILSDADNRPPMLEKDMYDSWRSRIELYMLNRQHGRMILESVEHGPLLWPTVEEDGVTRLKKYSELSAAEVIQADCDVKATNIILQALPPKIYALQQASTYQASPYATSYHTPQFVSQGPSSSTHSISYPVTDTSSLINHNAYMASSSAPQIEHAPLVQHSSEYSPPETGLVVPVFQKGDDPIDAINHMMSFLTAVVTSRYPTTNNQLRTSSNPRQQATINNAWVTIQPIQGRQNFVSAGSSRPFTSGSRRAPDKQRVIVCYNCKGEGHMSKQCTKPKRKRDAEWFKDKVLLVQAQANGQILQEEELEFLADPRTVE